MLVLRKRGPELYLRRLLPPVGLRMTPEPTKQMFTNVVEESEARKIDLDILSLLNWHEYWQGGKKY